MCFSPTNSLECGGMFFAPSRVLSIAAERQHGSPLLRESRNQPPTPHQVMEKTEKSRKNVLATSVAAPN
jgi:hypothetical protein